MSSLSDALLAELKPRIIGSPVTRVVVMATERLPAPIIAARGSDVGDLLVGLALFFFFEQRYFGQVLAPESASHMTQICMVFQSASDNHFMSYDSVHIFGRTPVEGSHMG